LQYAPRSASWACLQHPRGVPNGEFRLRSEREVRDVITEQGARTTAIRAILLLLILYLGPVPAASQDSRSEKTFSNHDVVAIVKAGLEGEAAAARVRAATQVSFDVSVRGLVALRRAGVPNRVILEMIRRSAAPASLGTVAAAATVRPESAAAEREFGNADIEALVRSGTESDGVIVRIQEATRVRFDVSVASLVALRRAHVPRAVLKEMVTRSRITQPGVSAASHLEPPSVAEGATQTGDADRSRAQESPGSPSSPVASQQAASPPAAPENDASRSDGLSVRGGVRLDVDPSQARVFLDEKPMGIADDWHRETLPLADGSHSLRFELPGHEGRSSLVVVSRGSGPLVGAVRLRLPRTEKVKFPEIPGFDCATSGEVVFDQKLAQAEVSVDGAPPVPGSTFHERNPLRLDGPAVHALRVTPVGKKPEVIRVLVSSEIKDARCVVKRWVFSPR
jgi:hypothetical protein